LFLHLLATAASTASRDSQVQVEFDTFYQISIHLLPAVTFRSFYKVIHGQITLCRVSGVYSHNDVTQTTYSIVHDDASRASVLNTILVEQICGLYMQPFFYIRLDSLTPFYSSRLRSSSLQGLQTDHLNINRYHIFSSKSTVIRKHSQFQDAFHCSPNIFPGCIERDSCCL
jgi:hypothetical protein